MGSCWLQSALRRQYNPLYIANKLTSFVGEAVSTLNRRRSEADVSNWCGPAVTVPGRCAVAGCFVLRPIKHANSYNCWQHVMGAPCGNACANDVQVAMPCHKQPCAAGLRQVVVCTPRTTRPTLITTNQMAGCPQSTYGCEGWIWCVSLAGDTQEGTGDTMFAAPGINLIWC